MAYLGEFEQLILFSVLHLEDDVCMLACIVPMRRALQVEPSEALRAEA